MCNKNVFGGAVTSKDGISGRCDAEMLARMRLVSTRGPHRRRIVSQVVAEGAMLEHISLSFGCKSGVRTTKNC